VIFDEGHRPQNPAHR